MCSVSFLQENKIIKERDSKAAGPPLFSDKFNTGLRKTIFCRLTLELSARYLLVVREGHWLVARVGQIRDAGGAALRDVQWGPGQTLTQRHSGRKVSSCDIQSRQFPHYHRCYSPKRHTRYDKDEQIELQ